MAALSYNLKKLLKFTRKNPTIIAQSMPQLKEVLLQVKNVFFEGAYKALQACIIC